LGDGGSGIFLRGGLDDPNLIESLQQIAFCAHGFFPSMATVGDRTGIRFCPSDKSIKALGGYDVH
jgi:hypothetical protein